MSLSSIRTNPGAIVALASLGDTERHLQSAEKQLSTGYRVADANDGGAAYALAQNVRSDIAALTAANQQLGGVQGLLSTTLIGINSASDELVSLRSTIQSLSDPSMTGSARSALLTTYDNGLAALKSYFTEAGYEGNTLLDSFAGASAGYHSFSVVLDDGGSRYEVGLYAASSVYYLLSMGAATSVSAFAALIATGGSFLTAQDDLGQWLATVGNQVNDMNNFISYNADKIDALNVGLGSLVDADLAAESTQLSALQVRQQLATQALAIANTAPSVLLSLFR